MYFYLLSPKKKNKGFSILEVLVAITILAIIMGFFYSFWWLSINLTQNTRQVAQKYMAARVFLDALSRELRSAPEFRYLDYKDFYWGLDPDNPQIKVLSFWAVAPDEITVLYPYAFYVHRISYYLEGEEGNRKLYKEIKPVYPGKFKPIKGPILEGDFDFDIELPEVKVPPPLPEKIIIRLTIKEKIKGKECNFELRKAVFINAIKEAK